MTEEQAAEMIRLLEFILSQLHEVERAIRDN